MTEAKPAEGTDSSGQAGTKTDKAEKGDGVRTEMEKLGVNPIAVASGAVPRGQWLRELPLAVRAGGWFFAHAGNTAGRTVEELEAVFRKEIDDHPDFDSPELIGGESIVESKDWYDARAANAQRLAVAHIVLGINRTRSGRKGPRSSTSGSASTPTTAR